MLKGSAAVLSMVLIASGTVPAWADYHVDLYNGGSVACEVVITKTADGYEVFPATSVPPGLWNDQIPVPGPDNQDLTWTCKVGNVTKQDHAPYEPGERITVLPPL